jgi:hypothetical protein
MNAFLFAGASRCQASFVLALILFLLRSQPCLALSVSTDGSTLMPDSGDSLVTPDGTWTFGGGPDSWGDWVLLFDGVMVGVGQEMEVDNGGQLYMSDAPGSWWLWQNYSWVSSAAPVPGGNSPDGSTITPTSGGSLTTSAGTWTFGNGPDSWGDWALLLNGNQVGIALETVVANGGQLYMADLPGPSDWWIWQNNSWSPSNYPINSGGINGQCGPENSMTTNIQPTGDLCNAGLASAISGSGPWNWTCDGINGGRPAYCATLQPQSGGCQWGNHGPLRGWPYISNGTIVADDGCPLQIAYSNEGDSVNAYQDLHDNGHYNTLRASIFLGQWYDDSQPGQTINDIENQLDNIVNLAQRTGLYVLIDNHNTLPDPTGNNYGCPDWSADAAIWSAIAPRYANASNVIYEIQNEPDWCGSVNYTDIAQQEDYLYKLIRADAPNTPIFAWSFLNPIWVAGAGGLPNVLSQAPDIDYSNAAVDFHAYSGSADDITNFVNTARSFGPATMSEYGICAGSSWQTVLSTLQGLNVSWSCGDGYPDNNPGFAVNWSKD